MGLRTEGSHSKTKVKVKRRFNETGRASINLSNKKVMSSGVVAFYLAFYI